MVNDMLHKPYINRPQLLAVCTWSVLSVVSVLCVLTVWHFEMSASEEKKCVSVKDLNMTDTPGLPVRYSHPLVCVVLLKLPLKDFNEGKSKMFTMTVADEDDHE